MVAHAALVALALVAIVGGGLGAAAMTGAFNTSSAANLNLGTLSPGENGSATATTTVHVSNGTTYKFQLEKEDRIGSTFSNFAVSVAVNGNTYNLTCERNDSHVNLSAGTYTFTVHLNYTVRSEVQSLNKTGVAFLFLHPAEQENETGDNETHNGTSDSVVYASSMNGSEQDQQDNSSRIVLFALTFQVNGNIGSEHQQNDTVVTRVAQAL